MNPVAMTLFSLSASRLLQAVCDIRTAGVEAAGGIWAWKVLHNGASAIVNTVRLGLCFYVVLFVWLAVSATEWLWRGSEEDLPFAVAVSSSHGPEQTTNIIELAVANLALATGLMMLASVLGDGPGALAREYPRPPAFVFAFLR